MAAKMSLCTISYNYEHYAGIDVEKLSNIINEYVKKEFADFNPQVSEPGSDMEMPDHVECCSARRMAASSTKATFCAVPSTFRMIVKWVD